MLLKCKKEHSFEIQRQYLYLKNKNNNLKCPYCENLFNRSILEKKLLEFIKQNYNGEIIENSKRIISPYEIDIYLPEKKLAFEFNGLYWHNELNKSNDYHLMKTNMCEAQGIHLIHIYEDNWLYKQEIVKSMILNLLGKSERILATKCEIKEVSYKLLRSCNKLNV